MSTTNNLEFKKLNFEQLNTLIAWAEYEGWNPGPYDSQAYWECDPDGFYGYFQDEELIAGGSLVSYDNEFGFMGFFIVKPEYRGKGIGAELWIQRRNTLLSRLNSGASIGMDGVIAMQPFYKKGGFEIAFKDIRYEKIGSAFEVCQNISSIDESDIDSILAYDKLCFGFSRQEFMLAWLKLPLSKTFKYVESGVLKGFSVLRKANTGYKICPLFAENDEVAKKLYEACLNSVVGEKVYLDIPTINQGALDLAKEYEARYVFECARMYYNKAPNIEINKVYGITTFELG